MSKVIYDNIKKSIRVELTLTDALIESKIYASKSTYGFAVDIVANKTYGNDAYFKVYQMQGKRMVQKNNFYIAARVYFTRPYYFKHDNEPEPTILWKLSSKDKKNINNILSLPVNITIDIPKGFDSSAIINSNLTTYQYLIFVLDKLNREIRGIGYSDLEILSTSISTTPIQPYFIPIDFPMPDYSNMQLIN